MLSNKTKGILKGPIMVVVILSLFTLAVVTMCAPADAGIKDWKLKWPLKYAPSIEVALNYEKNETICDRKRTATGDWRENIVGDIAIEQIWTESVNKRWQINSGYNHLSCAVGVDRESYDALKLIGFKLWLW